ncbi:MAG: AsmA family protein [Kiritimatiellae bacterium]|nr:AsmA family protein [Kiritimatiellia bacterium]
MKKILKKIGKVLGRVVLAAVVLLAVILAIAPNVAVKVVNAKAGDFVKAEVSIKDIDLNLFRGYVEIEGLSVGQPEGFEGDPLLELSHAHVKINVGSLMKQPIVISDVVVEGLSATIIKNADGVMNVEKLAKTPPEPKEEEPEEEKKPAGEPPAVALDSLLVENLKVRYVDSSFDDKEPLDVGVTNLVLSVTDILFDTAANPARMLPGRVKLTSRITQGKSADAHLGAIARLGVLSTNVPAVNAGVRLSGLDLNVVDPVLPPGIGTSISAVLGGSCLDVEADISMSSEVQDIDAVLVNKSIRLPLPTGGGFDNIMADLGKLLTARLAGQVTAVAGNVGEAGLEVAGTAAESALAVGKGAGKLVGNIGGGLLNIGKGAIKGDIKSVGAALKDTTVGSVKDAVSTVTDTAATAVSGVGDAASKGLGAASAEAWRTNAPARWATSWETVVTVVDNMPYPTADEPKKEAEAEPAEATAPEEVVEEAAEPTQDAE